LTCDPLVKMKSGYMSKIAIAVLVLSVGMLFLSGQTTQAAAQPYHGYYCYGYYGYYNMTYDWWHYGYPYYYYGYPYYCSYGYYSYSYPYYGYYDYSYYYAPASTPPKYQLAVTTDPSSLGTVKGGGTFTSGDSASFSVTSNIIETSANSRYVFSHWSGDYSGVGTSGSVVMDGPRNITAVYQLQYLLNVGVQPQSAPLPQGEGWYNAGDTATLSVPAQVLNGQDASRLVFQGWSVDGQSAQSAATLTVKMDSAHVVTAQYKQQYYLSVRTDQGIAYGDGWYDAGSTAQIFVSTPANPSYGVSFVFNGWQGDIQSNSQSTTVLMDKPKTVIASWRTDQTVLDLTIALGIIAAFLIAAGIIAYAVLNRRAARPQTLKSVPTQETKLPQKSEATAPPKKQTTPEKKDLPEEPATDQ
jgi:hypothetical protein